MHGVSGRQEPSLQLTVNSWLFLSMGSRSLARHARLSVDFLPLVLHHIHVERSPEFCFEVMCTIEALAVPKGLGEFGDTAKQVIILYCAIDVPGV